MKSELNRPPPPNQKKWQLVSHTDHWTLDNNNRLSAVLITVVKPAVKAYLQEVIGERIGSKLMRR